MIYTIVFFSIILTNILLKIGNRNLNKKKVFLIFCFLLLALLSGFRYQNEASDFQRNYIRILQASTMEWQEVFTYSSEWLHQVFRKIIADIFKNPQWYFIFTAFLIVGLHINCANKYAYNYVLFVILYYAIFSYFPLNNVTRQGIAVAITIFAWDALLEKNKLLFLFLMLIASLIHTSAIFFIPLYFLSNWKVSKKIIYIYIMVAIIFLVFNEPIIKFGQLFLYTDYTEDSYGMSSSNKLWLVLAILVGCGLYIYITFAKSEKEKQIFDLINIKTIKKDDSYYIRFKNMISHGAFLYIICIIISSIRILMFSRIAIYFMPCAIICIDRSLLVFKSKTRQVLTIFLFLFATIWFIVMNLNGKLIPTPYTPFWLF